MATETASFDKQDTQFNFDFAMERPFDTLLKKESVDLLSKWGIDPKLMQLQSFRFDATFRRGMADGFLQSLFSSPAFQYYLKLSDGHGGACSFPALKVKSIKYVPLNCTVTNLDMFDALEKESGVIRKASDGTLVTQKMMDVYLPGGVTISDQLRGHFMLREESEYVDCVPHQDKKEFLYHIMWRLVSGGALNQWDDNFNNYKDMTRDMYKDMVCVSRTNEGALEMQTHVFQIIDINGGEVPLFPKECGDVSVEESNHNFMYVVVNPTRREVVLWYNGFWSPF